MEAFRKKHRIYHFYVGHSKLKKIKIKCLIFSCASHRNIATKVSVSDDDDDVV